MRCQFPSQGLNTFCGFPWVVTSTAGRVYDFVCLLYDGSTRRLTESGFMEKPGIEPATPGLHGIALIHYTKKLFVAFPWVETSTGPGGFMICVFII